jgi:hypothetical protein
VPGVVSACYLAESAGAGKRRVAAAGRHVQDLLAKPQVRDFNKELAGDEKSTLNIA